MNALRRIAMGLGGTLLIAVVSALAAPKAAHAVLSALVTVTNTSANPVPTTDVMRSVAQNVELHCQASGEGAPSCTLIPPTGQAGSEPDYSVPSGSSLVITDVEIFAPQGNPVSFLLFSTTRSNPDRIEDWVVPGDGATHEFEFPSGVVIVRGHAHRTRVSRRRLRNDTRLLDCKVIDIRVLVTRTIVVTSPNLIPQAC